ncbi:hypothetical protein B296_00020364 [Ensete ventricosum]|uniref:Uncharacterized protein n=1 Tax=Ensete ventricosum TaxID=4639 RepID=A0A427AA10_ENSVE|nr:hypothetical protein B296_00020364 [Ensete ventricosum]
MTTSFLLNDERVAEGDFSSRSFCDKFRRGRTVIAYAIDDSKRGRMQSLLRSGEKRWLLRCDWCWVHYCFTILRQIWRGKGNGCFCNRRFRCGKGGGFFSPRRLVFSRARDAMDASSQMRHSASHTAPLFHRDAPPLASSQWFLLVASQRNAPLQQRLVPSQREGVAPLQQSLVTSQREGVAPLQQLGA